MMRVLLFIPLFTALLCYSFRNRKAIEYVNILGAALLAGASIHPIIASLTSPRLFLDGMLYMDALSSYMMAIVVLLSLITAIYSVDYMGQEFEEGIIKLKDLRHYYALMHLFIFTMLLTTVSNNLAVFWIAIEGTTLVSALLGSL